MKLTKWLPYTALLLAGIVAWGTFQRAPRAHAQSESWGDDSSDWLRSAIGLRIAPVPLNMGNRNQQLVGLGSYLVNSVAGCSDCHTNPAFAPGHNPYLGQPKQVNADGYLAGGHPFLGDNGETVLPPNITPDGSGRPKGLSFKKFVLAVRYGQDPDDPKKILQVMPWPGFQDLSDRDLRAIYEYLSSVPSIPAKS